MPSIDTLILCPSAGPPLGQVLARPAEFMAGLGFDLAVIVELDGGLPQAQRAFLRHLRRVAGQGLLLPRLFFRLRALDEDFPLGEVFGPEDCLVLAATPAGLAAARRLADGWPLILHGHLRGLEAAWLDQAADFLRRHGQALLILDYGPGGRVDPGSWPPELEAALWGQVLAVAGDEVFYRDGQALARDASLPALGRTGGLRLTLGPGLLLEDPQSGERRTFASLAEFLAHRPGRPERGA